MFFSNAVDINSRKRKKESAEITVPSSLLFRPQQQQQRPSSSQPLVSTALGLGLNHNVKPPQQPVLKTSPPFLSFTSLLTDDFAAIIQEQSDQIDGIIQTHADQLRCTLSEKWQRHYNTLIHAAEEKASKRLKDGELELEKTVRKNAELEERAVHFRNESQFWQTRSRKMEEAVESLREALHEAIMRVEIMEAKRRLGCTECGGEQRAEDAESSNNVDAERVDPVWMACKVCEKRVAIVMMWPCRHVCMCRTCDVVTKACPICRSLKTNSLEVSLPIHD